MKAVNLSMQKKKINEPTNKFELGFSSYKQVVSKAHKTQDHHGEIVLSD
jgi:hypothetical protein